MFKRFVDNLKLCGIKTLATILCFVSAASVFSKVSFLQCQGLADASKTEIKTGVTKPADKKPDLNNKGQEIKLDEEKYQALEKIVAENKEGKLQKLKKFWKPAKLVLSFLMMIITPSINQYVNDPRVREMYLCAESVGVFCIWNWIFECVGKKYGLE